MKKRLCWAENAEQYMKISAEYAFQFDGFEWKTKFVFSTAPIKRLPILNFKLIFYWFFFFKNITTPFNI